MLFVQKTVFLFITLAGLAFYHSAHAQTILLDLRSAASQQPEDDRFYSLAAKQAYRIAKALTSQPKPSQRVIILLPRQGFAKLNQLVLEPNSRSLSPGMNREGILYHSWSSLNASFAKAPPSDSIIDFYISFEQDPSFRTFFDFETLDREGFADSQTIAMQMPLVSRSMMKNQLLTYLGVIKIGEYYLNAYPLVHTDSVERQLTHLQEIYQASRLFLPLEEERTLGQSAIRDLTEYFSRSWQTTSDNSFRASLIQMAFLISYPAERPFILNHVFQFLSQVPNESLRFQLLQQLIEAHRVTQTQALAPLLIEALGFAIRDSSKLVRAFALDSIAALKLPAPVARQILEPALALGGTTWRAQVAAALKSSFRNPANHEEWPLALNCQEALVN